MIHRGFTGHACRPHEKSGLAEQPVKAAALLEVVNINDLIEVQIARKIINYRNRLPVEIVESNTKLAKLYACSCIITLRPEEAKDSLSILDKALPSSSAVEQLDLTTYCRGIQGIAQHLSGESQAAYYSCSQFLENISHENWLIASMSWAVLIQHRLFRVEFNLAGGVPMAMYENGEIDITGVGLADLERVQNPSDPLNNDSAFIYNKLHRF